MHIIHEDANQLLFEDYPAKPSRLIYFASLIIALTGSIVGQSNNLLFFLILFFIYSFLIYIPLFIYFQYSKKNPLTISLNRRDHLLKISHYSFFHRKPIILPSTNIARIEFKPVSWSEYTFLQSCKVTFVLENNISFSMTGNIFYFEAYERAAKKIADFINVEFKDKYL